MDYHISLYDRTNRTTKTLHRRDGRVTSAQLRTTFSKPFSFFFLFTFFFAVGVDELKKSGKSEEKVNSCEAGQRIVVVVVVTVVKLLLLLLL